jgi:hypothetical protein
MIERRCDGRGLEPGGREPLVADLLDEDGRRLVAIPVGDVEPHQDVVGLRVERNPVPGMLVRGEDHLERAALADLEIREAPLGEDAVLVELHLAFRRRQDELAEIAGVQAQPVGRARVDLGAEVVIVGVGAAPLDDVVVVAVEGRELGVLEVEEPLEGVGREAPEMAIALGAGVRVGGEIVGEDALAHPLEPPAEVAPGLAADEARAARAVLPTRVARAVLPARVAHSAENGPLPICSRTVTTGGFVKLRRCQLAPSTTSVCPEMKRA